MQISRSERSLDLGEKTGRCQSGDGYIAIFMIAIAAHQVGAEASKGRNLKML
ncbi:hypothetical protein [Comamonas odontotermitis]|uniref:hypothetical protein n=1 Tax=Comamonas odontotermitis TaxID=379895 RepID=UPI001CC5FE73|nr:hypothetical protein [Comamonas odontotermitis]UBB17429.1 hypothetical protein LAD35_01840 [Comamonas odontotermitis]